MSGRDWASPLRVFECAVCHRVVKGRRQIIGRMYVWTPVTHRNRCPGSGQAAVIADAEVAAKFAPESAYPEDDSIVQSARNPVEARLFQRIIDRRHDGASTPHDQLMGSLRDVVAVYRHDSCRCTADLPEVGFEPDCVSIHFANRSDLASSLQRLTEWLAAASEEQFRELIQPKGGNQ